MIRLGIRLTLGGGRGSLASVALTAAAVALGTAILLFGLSLAPALDTRYAHTAWRATPNAEGLDAATATRGLLLSRTDARYAGRALARVDVAALDGSAPVPPGIDRLPAAGEAFVSPALAALIDATPRDQLGDRFGRVVGTIGEAGLASPDELTAIVGDPPDILRAEGARVVLRLDVAPRLPAIQPILQLLLAITLVGALAPVAVFVATATRLSAARRDQRLAAMRLVGATPGQVQQLAIGEAITATVPGALAGVGLFFLLRPLVALLPLDGNTWFPSAIAPPLPAAIGLLLLVQVVGAVGALVAMRRITISPLGVTRGQRSRPLRRIRLLPLCGSLLAFAASLALLRDGGGAGIALWLVAGSFLGVVVGIAIAGPWFTMLVGRAFGSLARSPSQLLAARRLTDDPRSAFGAIAGVVMAVFVASVFYSISAFASDATLRIGGPLLPGGTLDAHLPIQPGRDAPATTADRVRVLPGVQRVGLIRDGQFDTADGGQLQGWIADCAAIAIAVPEAPACGPRTIFARDTSIRTSAGAAFSAIVAEAGPTVPLGSGVFGQPEPLAADAAVVAITSDRPTGELPAIIATPDLLADGGAAFGVARIIVATNGDPAAIEAARTAIERGFPTAQSWTVEESAAGARGPLNELGRIIAIGLIGTLLVAGCSLAIAVVGGVVERRRPLALLRLSGMPVSRLQVMALLEAAVPLFVVAVLTAAMGIVVAQILLRISTGGNPPLPGVALPLVLVVGIGSALGVVALTMPLLRRVTEIEATRFE